MTNKKLATVRIQGKDYVLVKDRVVAFNENFPNGCIRTNLISPIGSSPFVIKAIVTPDMNSPERFFTGHSQAVIGEGFINKTAALENAETSAVGRALAMMGIGVVDSVASADEVIKAKSVEEKPKTDWNDSSNWIRWLSSCSTPEKLSQFKSAWDKKKSYFDEDTQDEIGVLLTTKLLAKKA